VLVCVGRRVFGHPGLDFALLWFRLFTGSFFKLLFDRHFRGSLERASVKRRQVQRHCETTSVYRMGKTIRSYIHCGTDRLGTCSKHRALRDHSQYFLFDP
jgi:hypothetical protein